uniref:Reverse transcriptase domain-containing protein n=1 Tax=Plectus sambesii TaxID=2011161 RepID=A0A914VJK4_9BILA
MSTNNGIESTFQAKPGPTIQLFCIGLSPNAEPASYYQTSLQHALDSIDWAQRGLKVGDQRLPYLAYADDIVLLAHDVDELQSMADDLSTACAAIGLKVNVAKTKWLSTEDAQHRLHLSSKTIERVTSFIYLGQLANWPHDHSKEISRRLTAGWATYNKSKTFFIAPRIPMKLKRRLFHHPTTRPTTEHPTPWHHEAARHRRMRAATEIALHGKGSSARRDALDPDDDDLDARRNLTHRHISWTDELRGLAGSDWLRATMLPPWNAKGSRFVCNK